MSTRHNNLSTRGSVDTIVPSVRLRILREDHFVLFHFKNNMNLLIQLRGETSLLGSGRSDSSSLAGDTTTTTTTRSSWSTAATIRRSNVIKTDKTMEGYYEDAKSLIYSHLQMHHSNQIVTRMMEQRVFVLHIRCLVNGLVNDNISDEQITQIGEEYVQSFPGFVEEEVESSLTGSTASRDQVQGQAASSDRTNNSIPTYSVSAADAEKAVSMDGNWIDPMDEVGVANEAAVDTVSFSALFENATLPTEPIIDYEPYEVPNEGTTQVSSEGFQDTHDLSGRRNSNSLVPASDTHQSVDSGDDQKPIAVGASKKSTVDMEE